MRTSHDEGKPSSSFRTILHSAPWVDVLFAAMVAIQITPLWMLRFFPSQDGPSHLYTASILANYYKIPIYHDYFRLAFDSSGNLLTHIALAGLIRMFPPLIAEKVLLTGYLISFPCALRILLKSLAPEALAFSFYAFVLSYNFFFHMGFWNFCFSIPLVLITVWRIIGPARPVTAGNIAGLAALALATYMSHLVSWLILALAAGWLLSCEQFGWRFSNNARRLRGRILTFAAVLAPGPLMVLFLAHEPGTFQFPETSLLAKLGVVYHLEFLHSYGETETVVRRLLAIVTVSLLAGAIVTCLTRYRQILWNPFLGLAVVCALLAVLGPKSHGSGLFIRERTSIFAFLFLIVSLAMSGLRKNLASALVICLSCLSVMAIAVRFPVYKYWNGRLAEYTDMRARIAPGSVLLSLQYEQYSPPAPALHAAGYLASSFIDLTNYETYTSSFPVQFRHPCDDIARNGVSMPLNDYLRYLRTNRFPLDYILVDVEKSQLGRWGEIANAAGVPMDFKLIYRSRSDQLRLYQRTESGGSERFVCSQ